MTIDVRLANRADIPILEVIIPESVRTLSAGDYSPAQIETALVHLFGLDTQLIDDGTYCVAEVEGQVAGCGGWSRRKTLYGGNQTKAAHADPLLDPALEPARIRAFFVHPTYARRGVGAALMWACEQAAYQAGFRELTLVATLPGQRLYAAAGFVAVEDVAISMPGGLVLPTVRMTKRLV